MKKTNIAILITALSASFAFAHEGIELGPNKGRILELSKDETLHAEVTQKAKNLHLALLDKEMKPVAVDAQIITATAGTRQQPVKLEVTRDANGFTFQAPGEKEWLIIRYQANPESKPITARLEFDNSTCAPCASPEWRCACADEEAAP
jgi:hypothetical protein